MKKDNNKEYITFEDEREMLKISLQKDIYAITNELKRIKNIGLATKLIGTLASYENMIEDNDLDINFPKEYDFEINKFLDKYCLYIDKINSAYDYLSYNKMLYYNHKICDATSYVDRCIGYPDACYIKQKVDIDVSEGLVYEFFKEYDEKICDYYCSLINNQRLFYGVTDCDGVTLEPTNVSDTYIIIQPTFTIDDALTIAHETIHAYIDHNTRTLNEEEHSTANINNYFEIYSIFIELVFAKYLKDKNLYKEDLVSITKANIGNLCMYGNDYRDDHFEDTMTERYVYGYVLAFHFYNQYLVDKEKAKENITKFMLEMKEHDKLYMLNNYGLNSEELINAKKLKRYVSKYLKRIEE